MPLYLPKGFGKIELNLAGWLPTPGPRVKVVMGFLDAALVDVRIDLCCRYIRVPEHFLDDAQVRAVVEQVGGETVAQRVGCDGFVDAGDAGVFFDEHPN